MKPTSIGIIILGATLLSCNSKELSRLKTENERLKEEAVLIQTEVQKQAEVAQEQAAAARKERNRADLALMEAKELKKRLEECQSK